MSVHSVAQKTLINLVSLMAFSWIIVSETVYLPCECALTYGNGVDVTVRNQIFELFNKSQVLCIVSRDDEATVDFLNVYRLEMKPVITCDSSTIPWSECTDVVVIEMADCDSCPTVTSPTSSLYIINNSSSSDLKSLGRCLANSLSPEVVAISLADSSVWELSSVYSPPRHFSSSSVAEVIRHRAGPRTPDFGGRVITAAITAYAPFVIFRDSNNSGDSPVVESFDGIDAILFREMAKRLNFTLKYDIYEDWGRALENGSWTYGVSKAMQDKTADVAIANIWQIPLLYTLMDFGPSLDKNQIAFIVRRPKMITFKYHTFLTIFGPDVWKATCICMALVAFVYWAVVKLGRQCQSADWSESFLTMYGHLVMTSSYSRASDSSTRFILTSWSVFALLITTAFSSGIVSRLALPLYSARVDTLQQLVEQDYYWTVYYYVRFRNSAALKSSIFNLEDPWNVQFEQRYEYMDAKETTEKAISDEKLTFLVSIYGEHYPVTNIPGLVGHQSLRMFRLVKQTLSEAHTSWGIRKYSPLLKPLSLETLIFLQAGLPKIWLREVIKRWPIYDTRHLLSEEDNPTFSAPQPMEVAKILGVFYKLFICHCISAVLFIFEVLYYKVVG